MDRTQLMHEIASYVASREQLQEEMIFEILKRVPDMDLWAMAHEFGLKLEVK